MGPWLLFHICLLPTPQAELKSLSGVKAFVARHLRRLCKQLNYSVLLPMSLLNCKLGRGQDTSGLPTVF